MICLSGPNDVFATGLGADALDGFASAGVASAKAVMPKMGEAGNAHGSSDPKNCGDFGVISSDILALLIFESPFLIPFLSKIQSDTRVWLGTANEHVPGSGPLQRLRIINNRSSNQTSHAGMTDSSPARPSHRNVARFG